MLNTTDWTESAELLVGPPESELRNVAVAQSLLENPHLFQVVTLIHIEVFKSYLETHPNRAFIQLVCQGLQEGFWPWATTMRPGYPLVDDELKLPLSDEGKAKFLRKQHDVELAKGRFLDPFKHDLLPGMYSMPIYGVPKLNSLDFRLVTDQSCGRFCSTV